MKEASSSDQQRELVRTWDAAGRELERLRRERLRGKPYDWREVDALLQMVNFTDLPSRPSSGLVEMQRWFRKARGEEQ